MELKNCIYVFKIPIIYLNLSTAIRTPQSPVPNPLDAYSKLDNLLKYYFQGFTQLVENIAVRGFLTD